MTGFIFTFSLFCSAVLNADPAVLQRSEFAAMRQIIESVIPETQLHRVLRTRQSQVTFSSPLFRTPSGLVPQAPLRWRWDSVHALQVHRFLNARPIRAPSVC
jgi:hypothetical protein